jgi:hypothetical protein
MIKIARMWRLLGFDARQDESDPLNTPLPLEVREKLLLRKEIERPRSVDAHIWLSVFSYGPVIDALRPHSDDGFLEADADCRDELWLDLDRMTSRLVGKHREAVRVAVEVLASDDRAIEEFPSPLIYAHPKPNTLPVEARLLGFDVADAGRWSGLSNCSYSKTEMNALRPAWIKRVNDFGLLDSIEDALAFQELSNARVPEHAPFWVYRLHALE